MKFNISILITAYFEESKRYLDLCVESIRRMDYPKENLDIVIVAPKSYNPQYEGIRTVCPEEETYTNPFAINFGYRHLNPVSTHVLLLNDDVIMTKNALNKMIDLCQYNDLIVGAMSNCDMNMKHIAKMPFQHNGDTLFLIKQFYKYEELEPYFDSLMDSDSQLEEMVLLYDHLYLYANLIPKRVWDMIGPWDENYKTGYDDTDWCMRATQKGVKMCITTAARIIHFGGISTSKFTPQEDRDFNQKYFNEKWGMK